MYLVRVNNKILKAPVKGLFSRKDTGPVYDEGYAAACERYLKASERAKAAGDVKAFIISFFTAAESPP